jgi:hypothetical protein
MVVGHGMIMISSQLVEKVNNLPDEENVSRMLDDTLKSYTIYRKIGMIDGTIKSYRNKLITAETTINRIEKIVTSIEF